MATRRTRPNQQRPAAKRPVTPQSAPQATQKDQETDPATITPDANENPAEDTSGASSDDQGDAVPPAGPPEGADDTTEGTSETDGETEDGAETDQDDDDGDSSDNDLDETDFRKGWNEYVKENNIALPEGRVLFPGEPLTFVGNRLRGNVVEVQQDVYRLVIPFRSKRPTFTLVARKGTILSKARFLPKNEYRGAVGDLPIPGIEG